MDKLGLSASQILISILRQDSHIIENLADDRAALSNIKPVLSESGRAIIPVPQGPRNMGTLDEVFGHHRRYTQQSLRALARDCGLNVAAMLEFNRFGSIWWFLNGKIMRRRTFGWGQIWMLNMLAPILRRLDSMLPLPALSLIAVLEPNVASQFVEPDKPDFFQVSAAG